MEGFSWQVVRMHDGWAELRWEAFLFLVPVEQLPPDLEAGDLLDAQGGSQQAGYPAFRRPARPSHMQATA